MRASNPALYYEAVAAGSETPAAAYLNWSNSLPCNKTIKTWNSWTPCSLHQNTGAPIPGNINTLLVSPSFSHQLYPVQTLLYVYNAAGTYLGYFDLGNFQAPEQRLYNIAAAGLPMTSKFRFYFQISGGGSATIAYPLTINSTFLSASQ
ncbi:hypothetical protein ABWL39_19645 [Chitinivorax sp. PXF-14]|uniref:hypothetical protein n=1 Tax=Chitinivorax sp. PXF-14 TaxID=3230488 RepID=UPI003466876F